jgi:hypothetical protein
MDGADPVGQVELADVDPDGEVSLLRVPVPLAKRARSFSVRGRIALRRRSGTDSGPGLDRHCGGVL